MARTRSQANALARLLGQSELPIYAVDDRRIVIYANTAVGDWTGVDAAAIVGVRCDYHSDDDPDPIAAAVAALCPPPEAFTGERSTRTIAPPHGNDSREVRFMPLSSKADFPMGVLAVAGQTARTGGQPPIERATASDLHLRLQQIRRRAYAAEQLDRLVGESPAIQRVHRQIELVNAAAAHAVIVGPIGSGREHVARLIHHQMTVAGTLVPLDCSLLDAELLQGTVTALMSHFVESDDAAPPTLLLLDVDQLPKTGQSELGGLLELPDFGLHVIATSRRSLLELAESGEFSKPLAYLLSTVILQLPSLRERIDDVRLIAQYFVELFNARGGKQLSGFSMEATDELVGYDWPGNIDELSELVGRACDAADGPLIEVTDLPETLGLAAGRLAHPKRTPTSIDLDQFLDSVEEELIRRALAVSQGNKTKAARLLGISRPRLHRRL